MVQNIGDVLSARANEDPRDRAGTEGIATPGPAQIGGTAVGHALAPSEVAATATEEAGQPGFVAPDVDANKARIRAGQVRRNGAWNPVWRNYSRAGTAEA